MSSNNNRTLPLFAAITPEQEQWISTDIFIKLGKLGPIVKWCEDNCIGDWRFSTTTILTEEMGSYYNFRFEVEQDITMFLLRWL